MLNTEIKTTDSVKPVILDSTGSHDRPKPAVFGDNTNTIQVFGASMYPTYPPGCMVAYREVKDKSFFIPGEVYVIGTADYTILRRIYQSKHEGHIQVIADNPETDQRGKLRYEGFDVPIDKITFIGLIVGSAIRV